MLTGTSILHEEPAPPPVHNHWVKPTIEQEDILKADYVVAQELGYTVGTAVRVKNTGFIGKITYVTSNASVADWFGNEPSFIRVIDLPGPKVTALFHYSELKLINDNPTP